MAKGGHNKCHARWILATLAKGGWMNPPLLAVLAAYPLRTVSSCLLRLHRLGLVRRRDARGLSLYAISNLAGGDPGPSPGSPPNSRQSPEKRPPAALRCEARSQVGRGRT